MGQGSSEKVGDGNKIHVTYKKRRGEVEKGRNLQD